jgi:uncharacterized membrane protein YidH (DUF202 family)
MICNYSDHAANERTFLAWVRTGIAVIAFGFVIERFKLVVASMTSARSSASVARESVWAAWALRGSYHHVWRPCDRSNCNVAFCPHRALAQ